MCRLPALVNQHVATMQLERDYPAFGMESSRYVEPSDLFEGIAVTDEHLPGSGSGVETNRSYLSIRSQLFPRRPEQFADYFDLLLLGIEYCGAHCDGDLTP